MRKVSKNRKRCFLVSSIPAFFIDKEELFFQDLHNETRTMHIALINQCQSRFGVNSLCFVVFLYQTIMFDTAFSAPQPDFSLLAMNNTPFDPRIHDSPNSLRSVKKEQKKLT